MDFSRRVVLQGAAALGLVACATTKKAAQSQGALPAAELEELSVAQLQDGMANGRFTSRALCELYLARIAALNPKLNAVVETNPDALAIADALDRERASGKVRGPLHGIPVLVKDNIDTADQMATTAGSLALRGAKPPRDSHVVERLREAGAVLLGKTNLSEWANIRSSRSSSGWSARGGQCRNPYALDRTPCGSSSGSGVAVAANLCAVAVGTETDGSILCPSSMNGIVGLKPTLGLVSRAGIVPIAHSQDTAGPMARTVADAALLLGALAGADPRDAATAAAQGRVAADYSKFLDAAGLNGARIGVVREKLFGYSDEADRVANEALKAMAAAGAVIVDPVKLPHLGEYDDAELTVLLYELKHDLDAYLAGLGPDAPVHSLQEAVDFNQAHAGEELKFFGQDLFIEAAKKGPLTTPEYLEAKEKCQRLAGPEGIDAVMAEQKLDALFAPTVSPPFVIDLVNGDHFTGGATGPAAVAGYPSISVPAGYSFGLPVGVTFFGRAWSEPSLLKLAFAFEQATKARTPPRFLETLPL